MVIDKGITDKRHFISFYESDKQVSFRQAPKHTDSHLNPTNFQKMKVKLAAQLISASASAGLNTWDGIKFYNKLPEVVRN
jgi:hypothetical protein